MWCTRAGWQGRFQAAKRAGGRHTGCIPTRRGTGLGRAAGATSTPLARGILPRLVLISAAGFVGDAVPLRLLTCSHGVSVVAVRHRPLGSDTSLFEVEAASGDTGSDDCLTALQPGDRLPARALANWIAASGPVTVVLRGDVDLADALPPSCNTWLLRDGWVSAGDLSGANAVAAELVAPSQRRGGSATVVARASAPVHADDSHADLERRARELAFALLREVVVADGGNVTTPAALAPLGRWPLGASRVRAVVARGARRLGRRLSDPTWLAKQVAAIAALAVVAPLRNAWRTVTRSHPVHVFTFHRVSELCRDGMTVRPHVFAQQIAAIRRTHAIVSLDDAVDHLRSGTRLSRPLGAITFDDAYITVAAFAAPVLANAAADATCFVSTGVVGPSARFVHDRDNPVRALLGVMGWPELAQLSTQRFTVGAHTVTHPRLSQCDGHELEREITQPLAALREHLPQRSVPFAYPFGGEQDITPLGRHLVGQRGYSACLSDFGGENHPPGDPLTMRRIELGGDHASLAWRVRVHGLDLAALRPRWLQAARGRGVVHAA